jgi:NhaP-type Na+/H+ or K+/H+ antiporter
MSKGFARLDRHLERDNPFTSPSFCYHGGVIEMRSANSDKSLAELRTWTSVSSKLSYAFFILFAISVVVSVIEYSTKQDIWTGPSTALILALVFLSVFLATSVAVQVEKKQKAIESLQKKESTD